MSGLKGKRVLVTGASRGAGYGIAKAFAAAIRSEAGRSMVPPAAWCTVGLFCVWVLNLVWS